MRERHASTSPIVLPVSTSTDGLNLVETLARRGLAATLVPEAAGWRVEIPTRADHRAVLLDAISLAFADLVGDIGVLSPTAADAGLRR